LVNFPNSIASFKMPLVVLNCSNGTYFVHYHIRVCTCVLYQFIQLSRYPMYTVHKVAIIDKIKNKQKTFLHQWLASLIFRTFFSAFLSVHCDSSKVGNSSIIMHATGHYIILHDILFCKCIIICNSTVSTI
jgi:hypothetical protein